MQGKITSTWIWKIVVIIPFQMLVTYNISRDASLGFVKSPYNRQIELIPPPNKINIVINIVNFIR